VAVPRGVVPGDLQGEFDAVAGVFPDHAETVEGVDAFLQQVAVEA
jgi:hypothetical protein